MESSLALQLSDIAAEVGSYLGFTATTTNWTGWDASNPYVPNAEPSQLYWIMQCVRNGERRFYTPPKLMEMPTAHEWSFLTQLRTLQIKSGVTTYTLPDDYAGLRGELTYDPSTGTFISIKRTGIGTVNRALMQQVGITTRPWMCAVHLAPVSGLQGQRWQITFAPVPDATYTLTYLSRILPSKMTYQHPYPLGGEEHGQTIKQACLAAAEEDFNDEQTVQRAKFTEMLAASVAMDVQEHSPTNLGYNGDGSDSRDIMYGYGGSRYGIWPWGNNEPTYGPNNTPWSQL